MSRKKEQKKSEKYAEHQDLCNQWVVDSYIKKDQMFKVAMQLEEARQPRLREYVR